MARTSQRARRSVKPLTTWTRFYLPRGQEWPLWSVDHDDVHVGPLESVAGFQGASLGRMVDNPEQAAYIIQWENMKAVRDFQCSPHGPSSAFVESGSTLANLTLTDASPSTAPSRFLIFEHLTQAVTSEVEGRMTLTAFLIPRQVDDVYEMWSERFESVFAVFMPHGFYESITDHPMFIDRFAAVWFRTLSEDNWVEEKFGKLEQTSSDDQGRTVFCQFHLWPRDWGITPEKEAAAAADPKWRESWDQAIAEVMPPATSWVQERWDVQDVPQPPEPELDPEELSEYDKQQEILRQEFFKAHGIESDEDSEGMA
ncbi:hypothetical protein F4778DRAFT_771242 [Xylariomycetidae sp. FL2044]|nr:hypothetical protein F4778DRAFT_771242 [Xylariomycetidae sp. FL2044]